MDIVGYSFLAVVGVLAIGVALVALGAWGYPKLKKEKQGYLYEAQIEAMLLPWLFKAIAGAYKLSESASEEIGERLTSLDKRAVADGLYDILPDMIGTIPVGMVKMAIGRERFAVLVGLAFEELELFVDVDFVVRLDGLQVGEDLVVV